MAREIPGWISDEDCKLQDNAKLILGDGSNREVETTGDAYLYWDGTNIVLDCETDDSVFAWGDGTTSWDQKWYGANANTFLYLDASASLVYTTGMDFQFKDNDYLVFGTGAGATGDVQITWDATNLLITATADDSLIEIGDSGATQKSFDVKIYGEAANGAEYVLWDASASTWNFGVDNKGVDVKFFGETASAYALWDQSADALLIAGDARLDLSSATVAAANTDGGVFKAGTSGARVTEDTANMKFMSAYFDNGATSGDNRGFYLRLYLTGAGGGGEALRVFTDVENVAGGTAHGAHISLKFGTTGSITGQGIAGRNTLHIPSAAMSGGTYAALQAEIYSDGASSDAAGVTELSFIRVVNDGNATGVTNMDDDAFLITYTGGSIASGNVVQGCNDTATTHGIRCKMSGTTMYLLAATSLS